MKKYSYSISEIYSEKELNEKFDLITLYKNNKLGLIEMLRKYGIISTLDSDQITLKIRRNYNYTGLPLVSSKYYDEHDLLVSKIKLSEEDQKILSFEGEIYENLDFSKTDFNTFLTDNNYDNTIDEDVICCLHFKGLEWNLEKLKNYKNMVEMSSVNEQAKTLGTNNNMNSKNNERLNKLLEQQKQKCIDKKELYIYKTKNTFVLYYNAPYIYDSKLQTFTEEEIEIIIERINDLLKLNMHSEEDRFLMYVVASLRQYQINLKNRGYKKEKMIDDETLKIIEDCVLSNNKDDKNIFLKLKIVSDQPIVNSMEKENILLKK